MESVEFFFGPNPGEPLKPLRLIASSGELARVMLALKSALAGQDDTPLLVFDEIDANIGGETSRYVGEKLRRLGQHAQLLCITHQAQAAVYGHLHFRVHKSILNGRTQTQITPLHVDERPEEIARMLGGADFTPTTLNHAREMLLAATGMK
jgi:DNA repair protein RecN (Recombination protein N)